MATFTDVPIDDVRAWWNKRPCNINASTQPIGTRKYFDEVEVRKYFVEPHIPGFAKFNRWADRNVVEIGCGLGTDTINFARAGARVVATDLSERSLDLARQRARVFGVENIRFVAANAEQLTDYIGHEMFDLVYSFGVIHHSPHPERILAEARKALLPDGELRIMVYHRWSTKVLALILQHPLRALGGIDRAVAIQSEAQRGSPVTYTFTRRGAQKLVQDAGFDVVETRVDHIFSWRIRDYREHRYVRRWYWRLVPDKMFRMLERHYGWHLLLVCRPSSR